MQPLILWLLALPLTRAISSSKPCSNASFAYIGDIAKGSAMAHLVTRIDVIRVITDHEMLIHQLQQLPLSLRQEAGDNKVQTGAIQLVVKRAIDNLSPSQKIIEDVKVWFPHLSHYGNPGNRTKRQLLGLLTGGFALGLSVYNQRELSMIQDRLENMHETQNALIHLVEEQDQAISKNSENIEKLTTTVRRLGDTMWTFKEDIFVNHLSLEVEGIVNRHNHEIIKWGNGILSLIEGRLNLGLFQSQAMMDAIEKMHQKGLKMGLHFVETNPTNVLKGGVSHVPTPNGLMLMLHIPIMRGRMKLYRFHHQAFFQSQMHLRAPHDLLAYDDRTSQGRELDPTDLLHCHVASGNLYLCPNFHVFREDVKSTCLGAIFLGDQISAQKLCQYQAPAAARERLQGEAHQLSARTALLYLEEDTIAFIHCGPDHPRRLHLNAGRHLLQLDSGCRFSTTTWVFDPPTDFRMDVKGMISEPVIQSVSVEVQCPNQNLTEALSALNDIQSPVPRSFESLKRLQESQVWKSRVNLGLWVGVAFGLLLLLSAIILYACYSYQKLKKLSFISNEQKKPRGTLREQLKLT